jgi:hypothetical protein
MFAYGRVLGLTSRKMNRYQPGRRYEKAVVFSVDSASLDSTLIHPDELFSGETAYEGNIPSSALVQMIEIPVTRRLEKFAGAIQSPALRQYIGTNLVEHLSMKAFGIE